MTDNPNLTSYKTVRLPHVQYDEVAGYSLTMVAAFRVCIFGRIENGEMTANEFGQIVIAEWMQSVVIRPELRLDVFALMPNHFHGIVMLTESDEKLRERIEANKSGAHIHAAQRESDALGRDGRAHIHAAQRESGAHIHAAQRGSRDRTPRSISTFVGGFKGVVTAKINTLRKTRGKPVWQPSFHEHIIRNEQDLANHREYVINNPKQWDLDEENPDHK